MIPAIGLMIGAYIVTRMFDLMAKAETHKAVKVFAVLTVLITLVSVVDILNAGSSVPRF